MVRHLTERSAQKVFECACKKVGLKKDVLIQMAEMLLNGQRAVPKKILNANFEYRFPKLKEALENALENRNGV